MRIVILGYDSRFADAERYEIAPLFEAFLPKPDIYIDDMPATVLTPLMLDVADHAADWQALANLIVKNHMLVKPTISPSE